MHSEGIRGFVGLITHPWVTAVCEAVRGPDCRIVEAGIDVPGPSTLNQAWHRDFPSSKQTLIDRHLVSLAFDIATVDVDEVEDRGQFEIATGTRWDDLAVYEKEMFPPKIMLSALSRPDKTQAADDGRHLRPGRTDDSSLDRQSIEKVTTGICSGSRCPRMPELETASPEGYRCVYDTLSARCGRHLVCRIVTEVKTLEQAHTIEGLVWANYESTDFCCLQVSLTPRWSL